jgi:hypothetical protein
MDIKYWIVASLGLIISFITLCQCVYGKYDTLEFVILIWISLIIWIIFMMKHIDILKELDLSESEFKWNLRLIHIPFTMNILALLISLYDYVIIQSDNNLVVKHLIFYSLIIWYFNVLAWTRKCVKEMQDPYGIIDRFTRVEKNNYI